MALRDRTVLILIKSAVSSLAELNILFVNIPEYFFFNQDIDTLLSDRTFTFLPRFKLCFWTKYIHKGFFKVLRAFTLLFFEKDTET